MADVSRTRHGAGRIDHHPLLGSPAASDVISIIFDGMPMAARTGEPLLAALLAAGVRVLRTMPHSGEPRGGYCMVGRCADCMLIVDGTPDVQACMTPVAAGMVVETQHGLGHWPGAAS